NDCTAAVQILNFSQQIHSFSPLPFPPTRSEFRAFSADYYGRATEAISDFRLPIGDLVFGFWSLAFADPCKIKDRKPKTKLAIGNRKSTIFKTHGTACHLTFGANCQPDILNRR